MLDVVTLPVALRDAHPVTRPAALRAEMMRDAPMRQMVEAERVGHLARHPHRNPRRRELLVRERDGDALEQGGGGCALGGDLHVRLANSASTASRTLSFRNSSSVMSSVRFPTKGGIAVV